MARILCFIAAAALSACMFVVDIVARIATYAFGLAPVLVSTEPFRFAHSHPRSIFETKRAGLA